MCASLRLRWLGLGLAAACWSLHGAQLPIRHYTTADGLANNAVYGIASDARGFLWFGTDEGVSRFDGLGFTNGITSLPRSTIRKILIGRNGIYWLSTPNGVIRFRPDLPPTNPQRMVVIRPESKPEAASIFSLLEDSHGRVWCGTKLGLFVIDDKASSSPHMVEVDIGMPALSWLDSKVTGLAEDAEGGLWVGANGGMLYRRQPNGRVERFPAQDPEGYAQIINVFADRQGRIWVGRIASLERSRLASHPGSNGFERLSGHAGGVPSARVFDILQARDGDIWVAMYRFLAQFPADGSPVRVWSKENGLPSRGVGVLAEDRDGNIWMGTGDQGAYRLSAGGMLTYSTEDRIGMDGVISMGETLQGELYFAGRLESTGFRLAVQSHDGFEAVAPRVPATVVDFGWRPARTILQDRGGEWWFATTQGLCRYPRIANPLQLGGTLPRAVYTTRDGLPGNVVTNLFEDDRGNIWVGTETQTLVYWSREQQRFVPPAVHFGPSFANAFAEDHDGHIWIGDGVGQVWRMADGHSTLVAATPKLGISALLVDHAGRLWAASDGGGLLRVDQPSAAAPLCRRYGYADGLSSLSIHSLAEDRSGFIYVGTGGGVDRLDPDSSHIRHYTPADGIAAGEINAAYCDRQGVMWFGSNHGLTRLIPHDGKPADPPSVWLTGISIGGRPAAVSEAGESSIGGVVVQPGQEQIQFDFVGLSYAPGNVLRYQYRLGAGEWSTPIESRSVHYAAVAPGGYRFSVRAVNADGEVSPAPATVEFRVIPPLWRRTWFQALLLAMGIGGAIAVHRVRAARQLEIERLRSGIALDLHDDIASNLAQITIFSEIALREAGADSRASEPLARIAETARDTVECIGDIVWSMRPQKDGDLLQRIRRVGSDAFTSRQIEVSFHFAEEVRHLPLDPNTRRQVYLIYKEAVHNTVRHARATVVDVAMRMDGDDLLLTIRDNGRGMESPEEGNGLPGMRGRAASLRGKLAVRSVAGQGTEVELRAPCHRPRRRILPG